CFCRVAAEGQAGIWSSRPFQRQERNRRDRRAGIRRITGRSRGATPPTAGTVDAAEDRIGGTGERRSLITRQEPRSDQTAGFRLRRMIWWVENPARARSERRGVANLAESAKWLRGVRWHLSNTAALAVDF